MFSAWIEYCCKMLECSGDENDAVLAALVRLSSTVTEALRTINHGSDQTHQQSRLILLGLKAQLQNTEASIPPHIASTREFGVSIADESSIVCPGNWRHFVEADNVEAVVHMQRLFAHLCLQDGALLRLPRLPLHLTKGRPPLLPEISDLYASVATIHQLLTYILGLGDTIMANFSIADWCRFITTTILAIRLTLATPECPEFDTCWARSRLQLGDILERLCKEKVPTVANRTVDVLSAMRAILGVVRDKYNRRLDLIHRRQETATQKLSLGCPMLDGSMNAQMELWQSTMAFGSDSSTVDLLTDMAGVLGDGGDTMLQGLWGTTAGWTNGTLPQLPP